MQFVDTHCHIQSAGLPDTGERSTRELWAKNASTTAQSLVQDAVAAGVSTMIAVGCDVGDSELAVECAAQNERVYASIGIHPHEAAVHGDSDWKRFEKLAVKPKVVAIGECGLDYFYEHSPRSEQQQALRRQLALAKKHNLPVIFHVREAFDDFWPIFAEFKGIKGVLHSYTDSQENLKKAVKEGLFIGVNGIATFAKGAQLEVYKSIPLKHLLLETDAPFLTPNPFRGTINEPKQTTTVAAFLADLRNESIEQLASTTTQNAHALFGTEAYN